ncbi:FKBP-type peptidyl-prolyl cis-trans isomerase [Methanovulcanius yangii]|uniref:FKBP-type peptidyl-prolyl cis-trans isomerase n=1 Tax=Methanovulcanius yangii TaxID=1789227 RepID=UPI0029C9E7A4|nr:FKBP-type peptidyl-prolyl cis-trans isomerase [Methanovulcanius yangii]
MDGVKARFGDTVRVHFTTADMEGNVLESSRPGNPQTVVIGEGTINPLFEEAVIGCSSGDVRTVRLSADQAYGKYRKQLIFTLKKKTLSLKEEPEPGQIVVISLPSGQKTHAVVREVKATKIVVDANHPYAGKDLIYTLELVDVQSRPPGGSETL